MIPRNGLRKMIRPKVIRPTATFSTLSPAPLRIETRIAA